MATLRELRQKNKAVKSIQQITKAMKIISTVKLIQMQKIINNSRPFASKISDLISDLLPLISKPTNPLLLHWDSNLISFLVISSDRGLCGGYNTNIFKKTLELMDENREKKVELFVVGKKGRDYFTKLGLKIKNEYIGISKKISFAQAELIGNDLITYFLKEKPQKIYAIYNEFKSIVTQIVTVKEILPIQNDIKVLNTGEETQKYDFIYEPQKEKIVNSILPRYLKAQIYTILLEAYTSELGARYISMDSATRNAEHIIEYLTLLMNKERQASITKELIDIVRV